MADDKPVPSYLDRLGPWALQTAALMGVALLSSLITRCTGQPAPVVQPPPVVVVTQPGSPAPTVTVVHPSPQP